MQTISPKIVIVSHFYLVQQVFPAKSVGVLFKELNSLYQQLSDDPKYRMEIDFGFLRRFFASGGMMYLLADDNQFIGMATLTPLADIDSYNGFVDNVVIDCKHRGNGYSRLLMKKLLASAHRLGMRSLMLRSQASRVVAHELYKSLGFRICDTCVFDLDLVSGA